MEAGIILVMPGLVPASTFFAARHEGVDGRVKPAHDGSNSAARHRGGCNRSRPRSRHLFWLQCAGVERADENHDQADEVDEIGLRRGNCPPPKALVRGSTGFI